ncbi:phosphodiesterase [Pararhodobacter sp. SW119]|uniref:phosphodiesterase n=1 Tax=Pararhodobacter sp. SW119 TaxID=2780075 RepID=UPI001ADEEF87|nr:phosphodiesterase [Pararhodobacter sp. SW119]
MTRILQISDLHVVAAPKLVSGRVDTRAALARAVGRIGRILPQIAPVELLLITGDLSDDGRPADYVALKDLLAPVKLPVAVIPGNHDRRAALRAAFADSPGMPVQGPIQWCRDLAAMRLIALDTLVEGQSGGRLGPEALDWLAARLAEAPRRPAMIALHHPPFDTGIGFMDAIGLADAAELARVLARHGAETRVICGHVHRHTTGMIGGQVAVIAPSTAHAIAADYRDGAPVGFVESPPGMLLHEWAGSFRSTWIPVADEAGPFPF